MFSALALLIQLSTHGDTCVASRYALRRGASRYLSDSCRRHKGFWLCLAAAAISERLEPSQALPEVNLDASFMSVMAPRARLGEPDNADSAGLETEQSFYRRPEPYPSAFQGHDITPLACQKSPAVVRVQQSRAWRWSRAAR